MGKTLASQPEYCTGNTCEETECCEAQGLAFEMVLASQVKKGWRCGGLPIKLQSSRRRQTWANLGKQLSQESCKTACLSEELCSAATFRLSNGACSAFGSCDTSEKSSVAMES